MHRKSLYTLSKKTGGLLAVLALCCAAFASPSHSSSQNTSESIQREALKKSTPAETGRNLQQTFQTLTNTMFKYERGLQGDVSLLYNLIEVPHSVKPDFRDQYLISTANRLYLILQNIDYDPEEDIPENVSDSRTNITLGRQDGLQVTFQMTRTQGGQWRFAAETADNTELKTLHKELKDKYEKLSRADMEGDTFEPDLMSPYRTVRTLVNGVLGQGGFTLDDATQTLDLSELDPLVRKPLGRFIAVALYRILKFRSPLNMAQLSACPQYEKSPILLIDPKYGVISMHVFKDPETGIKAWKFTPGSLQVATKSYDAYMSEGMAELLQKERTMHVGKDCPIQIQVDDWVLKNIPELEKIILGLAIWKWCVLAFLLILSPILLWLVRFIIQRIGGITHNLNTQNLSRRPESLILPLQIILVGWLWLQGIMLVETNPNLLKFALLLLDFLMIITTVWISWIVVEFVSQLLMGADRSNVKGTVILVVSRIVKIALVVSGLVYLASLFGQDSSRILTALGIGGVALALAGKDTVENIFGTFMILSTNPFSIGDWIKVDDFEGTVENVGIRSTAIRTFYNSLVNVPNATFIKTPVDNMGKRVYRRYKSTIRVNYHTPPDLIESFMEGIRKLVLDHPLTRKDYFHIRLNDFSHSSLEILVYIFFNTDDWTLELEGRERFILGVVKLAETMGVQFAFPRQNVTLTQEKAPESILKTS